MTTSTLTRDDVDRLCTRRLMLQRQLGLLTRNVNRKHVAVAAARIERARMIAAMDAILDQFLAARAWTPMGGRGPAAMRKWREHKTPEWCK